MQVKKIWVLRADDNQFVAIDSNSGGYPYLTDFWNAKKFDNKEAAQKYGVMFTDEKWELYETDEVALRFVAPLPADQYEVELAALKKKYNRT